MTNYLPPATTYDSFLETFDVPIRKSYFPYEYMTDISKLQDTTLPPKEAFYSSLKKCNTLENKQYIRFRRLIDEECKSEDEALKILQLITKPQSTIDQNYAKLRTIWKDNNMKTMLDFFKYYSELDLGPFVQGVVTFQNFFFQKELDVFKDFVSWYSKKTLVQLRIKARCFFLTY
jgi:hypothetical protein